MLGEPHDLGRLAGLEIGERDQPDVLHLLHVRLDRPAVWAAIRVAEPRVDPLDHLVGERVADSSAWTCDSLAV